MKDFDQKWCNKCERFRPKDKFYGNKSKPDGLQSECMTCVKKTSRVAWRKMRSKGHDFDDVKIQIRKDMRIQARKFVIRAQIRHLKFELQKLTRS